MRNRVLFAAIAFTIASAASACSSKRRACSGPFCEVDAGPADTGPVDAGIDAEPIDTGPIDSGPNYGDAAPVDPCVPSCGPEELCGEMGNGDGLDNDCDGIVDEICPCGSTNETRACFLGPPDRQGRGTCADGVMTCTEFLTWGPCTGGQFPTDESCDGADNDCNGVTDDGLSGCSSTLLCPGTQYASPLSSHLLRGSTIYTGAATSWRWTVTCPPTVGSCPMPADPNARDTSIYFSSSGSYRTRLEIVTDTSETKVCEWVISVQGEGLRVELDWDTQGEGFGNTDVDLHLHRKSTPTGVRTGETDWFTDDDCYYSNCKASTYDDSVRDRWGLADTSDVSACETAPRGEGAIWSMTGACYNPRLDIDVISCDPSETTPSDYSFCAPENINIDNPEVGKPYRIGVHYFSDGTFGSGSPITTYPTINIYCGGALRAALGSDPLITLDTGNRGGFSDGNDFWLVADVVFRAAECGRYDCEVMPLGIVQNDRRFGPEWSFD